MGYTKILLRHTDVRHSGRRVTVIGIPSAGLLAVTDYNTSASGYSARSPWSSATAAALAERQPGRRRR